MSEYSYDPAHHARTQPDATAVVDLVTGKRLSYRELIERSARLANAWWELGLRPRDHVAVFMESGVEFVEVYWAAIRSGLYVTAVNNQLTTAEAAHIIDNCDAQVLVVSDQTIARAQEIVAATPQVRHRITTGAPAPEHANLDHATAQASPVWEQGDLMGRTMFYSSGSTGKPKGILRELSGRSVSYGGDQARSLHTGRGLGREDVYLSAAPLYHAVSAVYADATIANGGTLVLMGRFDAEQFLETVEKHRITFVLLVPTMMVRLMKLSEEVRAKYDISSLRVIVHGAGPCPSEIKRAFIEWVGPIVAEYYGGTEDAGHTVISSEEWLERPGSVGRARGDATIRIVGEDGSELPAGETGLVYFESPGGQAEFEYHKSQEAASSAHHPQHPTWVTLGDIGYVDGEDYLYLSDRRGYMIVRGGVNIYPREVEDGLLSHPDVADAAVFSIEHPDLGEEVVAVVEPVRGAQPGADLAASLTAHARTVMAHYKVPTRLDFVETLSRAETGKLNKAQVRKEYLARREAI